jgi:hypothetical protein
MPVGRWAVGSWSFKLQNKEREWSTGQSIAQPKKSTEVKSINFQSKDLDHDEVNQSAKQRIRPQ